MVKWKNNKVIIIDKKGTCHHLFDYYDVRDKIMEIIGEPKTEEGHTTLQRYVRIVMDNQVSFKIPKEKHRKIHMKRGKHKWINHFNVRVCD